MSTKDDILTRIRANTKHQHPMPALEWDAHPADDLLQQFQDMTKAVGGQAVVCSKGTDLNALIRSLFPDAQRIATHLKQITVGTVNPDETDDPHELNPLDLSVVQGEIGVAENGCVWIPQKERQKVIYFIAEQLVIVLDKHNIVDTMHTAYQQISRHDYNFGVFISGPSKTADIEQALVMGAHGARAVTVIIQE